MLELSAKYEGDRTLQQDTVLRGIIVGNATVPSDVSFTCHGMVTGDVIVQAGGEAVIHGTVQGMVINKGGIVRIYGIVGALWDENGFKSMVHQNAIVSRRKRS